LAFQREFAGAANSSLDGWGRMILTTLVRVGTGRRMTRERD
jgi:hypothetical protein